MAIEVGRYVEKIGIETDKQEIALNPIKPNHYQMDGKDLIDQWAERYPTEVFVGIMESHIEKYIVRHTKKGKAVEDLQKAGEYISRLIKYYEEEAK